MGDDLLCPACRIARSPAARPARRIALLAVVVAGLGGGGFLLTRRPEPRSSSPSSPGATAPQAAETPPRRFRFGQGGLSLVLPPGLGKRTYQVGHSRVLEVTRGARALLTFNSQLVYPWGSCRDLAPAALEWHEGDVVVPELGLRLPFSGTWGLVREPRLRLFLGAEGRLVTVSSRDWKEPGIEQVLASYRPTPGADSRSLFGRGIRPGPPPPTLRKRLDAYVQFLGDDLQKVVPSLLRPGVERYRAGKLDGVDCALLFVELRPLVKKLAADRKSAASQHGCPDPSAGVPPPKRAPRD